MRLNKVDERRNNRSGNLMPIAFVAGVIVVLLIVAFLIFGGNSEESGSQTTMESDNVEILDPTVVPTLMPTSQPIAKLVPTALPTTAPLVPTALPTALPTTAPSVPTAVPTVVPITIPTPVPTIEVIKLPLPSIVNDNPPHVFVGTVTISGQPAPEGTEVTAWVLNYSEPAGSSIVPAVSGEPGSYSLLVPQYGTNFNGTVLVLKVNDTFVTNAVWVSGEAALLDLTP
jgi:hypothetical protein